MWTNTKEVFRQIKSFTGSFAITAIPVSKDINGSNATLIVLAGNVWMNPNGTADANSIKLTSSTPLNFTDAGAISLVSDESGATAQLIIWGD